MSVATLNLSNLDGDNGFVLTGISAGDNSGHSVASAGDVNGDGFDDLIIGAFGANGDKGESYVVFGSAAGFPPTVDLAALLPGNGGDGSEGFVLTGIDAGDRSGQSVASAGDVNGDGLDDLLVGALRANGYAGESYVVFGSAGGFSPTLDLAALLPGNGGDGSAGFVIDGIIGGDQSGVSVASAGDVNGDGYDDLLIGALGADGGKGESYVVFGAAGTTAATIDLADLLPGNGGDGSRGFVVTGIDAGDSSGRSVSSAGDVNGDGFDDLLIGGFGADANAGESYVVFGAAGGATPTVDLADLLPGNGGDGSQGFVIRGIDAGDRSGRSVASAGDVNGDGFDDIIIGASYASLDGFANAGESYVVFGAAGGFSPTLDLASLLPENGFVVTSVGGSNLTGYSVAAAGDVNGDGFDDVLIGARLADPESGFNAGATYVLFGADGGFSATLSLATLLPANGGDGSRGIVLPGVAPGDGSGSSVAPAGDVNGDGFDDILIGAAAADPGGNGYAGESYVVYGTDFRGDVTHMGTAGDDFLRGTSRSDVLIGGLGDDRIDGRGGRRADVMKGGGGDDTLVYDARDRLIDGGSGEDTLELSRIDRRVDLTQANPALLRSIEVVDLSERGGHTLTVDVPTVLSLSDASNTLRVDGASGDRVITRETDWDFVRVASVEGEAYAEYTRGAATLLVDYDVDRAGIGTAVVDTIELADLGGGRGVRLAGIDAGDDAGRAVASAGDVNGDGIADLIIGAPDANATSAGDAYVVFGTATAVDASFALDSLLPANGGDGSLGFVLQDVGGAGNVGTSVAGAGDVNDDGIDDFVVGAITASGNVGAGYVVFGSRAGFDPTIDLADLDGSNGFRLDGFQAGSEVGTAVSVAGDVNGDGVADILIGAENQDSATGTSFLVFGSAQGFESVIDLSTLDGSNGLIIPGLVTGDRSGGSVAGAGDVNGDGLDDIIIGSRLADPSVGTEGESYVVFGAAALGANLDLAALDGTNGFRIDGIAINDRSGGSVAGAGDVNGDGFADLVIGASNSSRNGASSGESYVVFGSGDGFAATIELAALDGSNGFRLEGLDANDFSGASVASAGDVNGDGYADLLIGALGADGFTGESYLVFGSPGGFGATVDLAALDGSNGIRIAGAQTGDTSGGAVASAGDLNGDGFDDIVIGAYGADGLAGAAHVVYGTDFRGDVTHLGGDGDNVLTGTSRSDVMLGGLGDDRLDGRGGRRADVMKGGGGDDILVYDRLDRLIDGGRGDDTLEFSRADRRVDLTDARPGLLTGIEAIDLSARGGHTLTLDSATILALSDTSNTLRVEGAAGDRVFAGDGWSFVRIASVDGEAYAEYRQGAAVLQVDTDVNRAGIVSDPITAVDLATLDGARGFALRGVDAGDLSGRSLASAGDVNGDGLDDIIIGAFQGAPNGNANAGESYVVFGAAAGFPASVDLASLAAGDGSTGFVLQGIESDDRSGGAVASAGDVNGDGLSDLVIGADFAGGPLAGESYLVFGAAGGFAATVDLSDLLPAGGGDGSDGVVLLNGVANERAGYSVASAGDINGDGRADVIIGAPFNGNGQAYVVFGTGAGFPATLTLSDLAAGDGSTGFVLEGTDFEDASGWSVAGAGDVNGDGFDDVIVGAPNADPGAIDAGRAYLVYGHAGGFASNVSLSSLLPANGGDGSIGVVLDGIGGDDLAGRAVASAGDVNGDGYGDLIVGAPNVGAQDSGASYVVFGAAEGLPAALDMASLLLANGGDGSAGFVVTGDEAFETSGRSVASAGDVNGDGFDDLLIGAPYAMAEDGQSYLLFGKASGFAASIDVGTLAGGDGTAGFVLTGAGGETAGRAVASAGDVNGDGFDDILIGAPSGDPGGDADAGQSYLVYGTDFRGDVTHMGGDGDNLLIGTSRSDVLIGGLGDDRLDGRGGRSADVMRGGGGDDTLVYDARDRLIDGGRGEDTLEFSSSSRRVDLTVVRPGLLESFEVVDLSARGGHTLTLDAATVLGLSESSNTLRIDGARGDRVVTADDGWDFLHYVTVDGQAYAEYTQGAATLLVDFDVNRAGIGGSVLPALGGPNGVVLLGAQGGGRSGESVASAGDVNGDGFDDLIVGAPSAGGYAGESYVVFGSPGGMAASLDLASLLPANGGDGSAGFAMVGAGFDDYSGRSVASAGDVNGDGFADVLIGAPGADPHPYSGESYLLFGDGAGLGSSVDLDSLATGDGSRGSALSISTSPYAYSGRSVASAGDVNGDGFDDLVIGASGAGYGRGESYVVFGASGGFPGNVELGALAGDGSQGFTITTDSYDSSGASVASAGDVNGDGFDDLIIGAPYADPNGNLSAGESYVVFGAAGGTLGATVSLPDLAAGDGSQGFVVQGIDPADRSGRSVASAGDVNGDGIDDLVIGAAGADPDGVYNAGESYVVFGTARGFGATLDLGALGTRRGPKGFVLTGSDPVDRSGTSVASAGDVNGDGFDDILIGAPGAAPDGGYNVGETYVVFGAARGIPASVDLADLAGGDGSVGFVLRGTADDERSGTSVAAAGDVDGDGFDDFIIGAPGADGYAGRSYVVHGSDFRGDVTQLGGDGDDVLRGTGRADVMLGGRGDDTLNGSGGNDVLKGGAGDDTLIGGSGTDRLFGGSGDDVYVVDSRDHVIEGAAAGIDTVVTRASYTLGAHLENLVLDGSANNRTLTGNALDNTITGNRRNDTLQGLAGDDTLDGAGGRDKLRGGDGDDILVFDRLDTAVDGGAGHDTLFAAGAGTTLDFTLLDVDRFSGIERVDLSGGGGDALVIQSLHLLALSDTSNQLIVDGDADDAVSSAGEAWVDAGLENPDGVDYQKFLLDDATLLVRSGIDTSGIDLF